MIKRQIYDDNGTVKKISKHSKTITHKFENKSNDEQIFENDDDSDDEDEGEDEDEEYHHKHCL